MTFTYIHVSEKENSNPQTQTKMWFSMNT